MDNKLDVTAYGEMESNPYIINVSNDKSNWEPVASAATKEEGIEVANSYLDEYKFSEVVYMPEDDLDTNDVVWGSSEKGSAVESGSSDKENYLREMAKVDYEVGHTQDPDDFSLFRRICLEDGYRVTKADFNRYFEILDEIRSESFEEEDEDEYDDEEMSGFEAMSMAGLERLTTSLASALKEVGSVVVLQTILEQDYGDEFNDEITFIKNTTDLSNSKEVLDKVLSASELMLDNVQMELLAEAFETPSTFDEVFPDEMEEELGEYQEPEDWSTVDQPEEEPNNEEENLELEEEPVEEEE